MSQTQESSKYTFFTCKCASDFVKYYRNGNQSVERAYSKSGNKIKQFPPQFCHPLTVGGAVLHMSFCR